MAKDNRSKHRGAPWDGAIRRKDFVPTKNSKVCGLHFVPGIAINNPESVDYVPSVKVGYEKRVSARENGPARGQSTGQTVTLLPLSIGRCFSTFHPKRTRCIIGVAKLKTTTKQRQTKGYSEARQKRWPFWECWFAWKWACSHMAGDKWVGLSLLILVQKWRLEVPWKSPLLSWEKDTFL